MTMQALNRKQQTQAAAYLPLIERVAKRLVRRLPSHVDVGDLISAGMLGLADAMAKFDPSRETRFEEYAEWRIKGAMLDELRSNDPLTRDQRREVNEIKAAAKALANELGREPEETELAKHLGVSMEVLRERRERLEAAAPSHVESFDHHAGNDADAEFQLLANEQRERVAEAIAELPERLRTIIQLSVVEELSLKEIGAMMGVTESRVCQLRGEAIAKLRTILAE